MRSSVYIIAEAGVNHNGDEKIAHTLVDIAADAGADAVKFQLFFPPHLVTQHAVCADYQSRNLRDNGISQLEMLQKLTLEEAAYVRLADYCARKHIDFICTPFDLKSLRYLTANTHMPIIKLASGEVTHGPLLLEAARTGMKVVLSTGMSNLEEISRALAILHYGYTRTEGYPDAKPVTPEQLAELCGKVTLLHCVSQYPAPVAATNLLAMDTLADSFGLPVGLSDHSVGITMSVAAAARGAVMLEKHFTFDTSAQGPDHAASLPPGELKALVQAVRDVAAGMGDGKKICRPEELNTRDVARRSVVAARAIAKREVFSEDNLICKRPSSGPLPPDALWQLLGQPAKQAYAADDFIQAGELAAAAAV